MEQESSNTTNEGAAGMGKKGVDGLTAGLKCAKGDNYAGIRFVER